MAFSSTPSGGELNLPKRDFAGTSVQVASRSLGQYLPLWISCDNHHMQSSTVRSTLPEMSSCLQVAAILGVQYDRQ
jgi:hypothetical protein